MKVKKKSTALVPAGSTALAVISGVNDLTDNEIKEVAANATSGAGFLKLAQATSWAVTAEGSTTRIGDFTIGQDNRNLGKEVVVIPIVRSYRAQLWGRAGKDKGRVIAESRVKDSVSWKRVEASRGGELGFEFTFYHPEDKVYSIFSFGKYKHRPLGEMIALGLQHHYGKAFVIKSVVVPGKSGNPPIANLTLAPYKGDKTFKLPPSVDAARADYLEKVNQAIAEEKEAEKEAAAPEGKPR